MSLGDRTLQTFPLESGWHKPHDGTLIIRVNEELNEMFPYDTSLKMTFDHSKWICRDLAF